MSNPLVGAGIHERTSVYTEEKKRVLIRAALEAGKIILTGSHDKDNIRAYKLTQSGIAFQNTHNYTKLYERIGIWNYCMITMDDIIPRLTRPQIGSIFMFVDACIAENPNNWRIREYTGE